MKTWRRSHWPRGLRPRSVARSPAEIVASNPTGVMDVCLLWVLCVVRRRPLRRADHSSRGVLPSVVRRCVWSSNLMNEETVAHWELLCQWWKKEKVKTWIVMSFVEFCQQVFSVLFKYCWAYFTFVVFRHYFTQCADNSTRALQKLFYSNLMLYLF